MRPGMVQKFVKWFRALVPAKLANFCDDEGYIVGEGPWRHVVTPSRTSCRISGNGSSAALRTNRAKPSTPSMSS